MNRFRIHIVLFFAALAFSMSLLWLNASAKRVTHNAGLRSDSVHTPAPPAEEMNPSSEDERAKRNQLLRNELTWIFGSKPQRGWYLYTPLINRLIGTKDDYSSKGFARALARWQTTSGLAPTGVLNDETLYKMIGEWQGRRIKDRTPAQPAQLLKAPISDFYDPTRAEELLMVERDAYFAYKRLVAAALAERSLRLGRNPKAPKVQLAANEPFLKIISSFRSREYQEKLRRESPNSGTAGLAVNSPHFTGRALDLYVGGEPVDTRDSNRAIQVRTPVYFWLVRNAERFGFRPYFYEPWHWEYVGGRSEK